MIPLALLLLLASDPAATPQPPPAASGPTLIVNVPEYRNSRWRAKDPIAEAELAHLLSERGLVVLGPEVAKNWRGKGLDLESERDLGRAAEVGEEAGASLLVLGEAISERGRLGADKKVVVTARLEIKLVRAGNAEILGSDSESATGTGLDEAEAGRTAIANASKAMAARVADAVAQQLAGDAEPAASTFMFHVAGIALADVKPLKESLLHGVKGLHALEQGDFAEGALDLTVLYIGDAASFGEAIDGKTFGARTCRVKRVGGDGVSAVME